MTLFNKVFSTRTLLQIICVLGTIVVMKGLSGHYDFSWATALGLNKKTAPKGVRLALSKCAAACNTCQVHCRFF